MKSYKILNKIWSVTQLCLSLLWPHGLQPTRLLCPLNVPGKNTEVGCHFLLQGIFLTQESNPHFLRHLHCRRILYPAISIVNLNVNGQKYSNSKESRTSLVAQTVNCLPTMWGDMGSIPGLGRSPGEGNGNPLQYFCLENPMDGEVWQAIQSVGSQRIGHDFTFTFKRKQKDSFAEQKLLSQFEVVLFIFAFVFFSEDTYLEKYC